MTDELQARVEDAAGAGDRTGERILSPMPGAVVTLPVQIGDEIAPGQTVAVVDPMCCSSCGVCVEICPYSAPQFIENTGKAEVQATLCKGCGLCVASCRSGAIRQKGFETEQIMSMIGSCLIE